MKLIQRGFAGPHDTELIRSFLRKTIIANNGRQRNWDVVRFDYWIWLGIKSLGHGDLESGVFIWENDSGELIAVLNREGPGNVFLQLDPEYESRELLDEMVLLAVDKLTVPSSEGGRRLRIWCDDTDTTRQSVLAKHGFTRDGSSDYHRIRRMSEPMPDVDIPSGYTIRSMQGEKDIPPRSFVSWRAFHPDESTDQYQGSDWYPALQQAPLYNEDLDIVAVAPNGEFASFCTVWHDKVTGIGTFEPVGTAPDHQHRGLASAVIVEGIRRLAKAGGKAAHIGSWNDATHRLYGSLGFTDYHISEGWSKKITG